MNHVATHKETELNREQTADITVHPRICPICESSCGLLVKVDSHSKRLLGIRGDEKDPLSKGFLCPKGYAWTDLHNDPNVLKTPLIRRGDEFFPATWDEALDLVGERLNAIRKKHGPDSVGFYIGNPIGHKAEFVFYAPLLLQMLGTRNLYSAGSLDNIPKFLASALMYGDSSAVSIPDVDRTSFLVIQGSNPAVSNGSMMTAPGMPRRIKEIRARGGKVIVIDPRFTETAKIADQHVAIRPGTDAYFLLAVIHQLFTENLVHLDALEGRVKGIETIRALAAEFPAERVAVACGVPADVICQLARDFAAAETGIWHGRIGTCTQSFGTLTTCLQDVINVLTGNVDRPGGVMFSLGVIPMVVFNEKYVGDTPPVNRWQSRVSGLPEVCGTLPTAVLPEEILTPGEGQIRAFITMAGNPALSNPNSHHVVKALDDLEFLLCFDIYLNETTRHADVILPSPPHAMHSDFHSFFVFQMTRNVARWSPPIFEMEEGQRHNWEILLGIAARVAGITEEELEEEHFEAMLKKFIAEGVHPLARSIDPAVARAALGNVPGPDRIYDLLVRTGRSGDAFGLDPEGLNLEKIKQHPHGLDLGPMVPRLDEILATPDKKIDLAPAYLFTERDRLHSALPAYEKPDAMVMIGRREPTTINSWSHNLHALAKGRNRCVAKIHSIDATRLKLSNGSMARVSTTKGAIDIPVEITDEMMVGVISIPHGWGHDQEGTNLDVARRNPGVNFNSIVDERIIDGPSATAVLTGIPVTVVSLNA